MVQQSTLSLSANSPVDLAYSLSADANVTITIYDINKSPVRVIDVGDQLAGGHTSVWDGRNGEGIRMPAGEYNYEVSAVDANGRDVTASEIISGVVDGLIFDDEPYVSIGGMRVPLAAVTEVLLDTQRNEREPGS